MHLGTSSFAGPRSMAAPLCQLLQNARSCLSPSGNDRWRGYQDRGMLRKLATPNRAEHGFPHEMPIGKPTGKPKHRRAAANRQSVASPGGAARGYFSCRGSVPVGTPPVSPSLVFCDCSQVQMKCKGFRGIKPFVSSNPLRFACVVRPTLFLFHGPLHFI